MARDRLRVRHLGIEARRSPITQSTSSLSTKATKATKRRPGPIGWVRPFFTVTMGECVAGKPARHTPLWLGPHNPLPLPAGK